MKQLVTPNLNITYTGGYCERAAENTVGQTGIYGSAYKAWKANKQHTELPPKGFYVPVYLNMPNGPKDPDGTQQDDVAISCPDGTVAAAALAGTHKGLYKYPSLQAYINDYAKNNGGATYRGYGEFIGTIKVIEGDTVEVLNKGDIVNVWQDMYGRAPTQADFDYWLGRTFKDLTYNKLRKEFVIIRSQVNNDKSEYKEAGQLFGQTYYTKETKK